MKESSAMNSSVLIRQLTDARCLTLELVADLTDEQLLGPQLDITNPLIWEIGHVAWFQEKWTLRHLWKEEPVREEVDRLYDSIAIPHDARWDLPLLSRQHTLDYIREVLDRIVERLEQREPAPDEVFFYLLALFHEDMHDEAFTYTRQTLGYPAPKFGVPRPGALATEPLAGDVEIPGGTFLLGAVPGLSFVFDNEKWAHPVDLKPFRIARAPVTNAEFAAFVEEGGYERQEWWSEEGWRWKVESRAGHPVYWRRDSGDRWMRQHFAQSLPLEEDHPVIHVNWYEAAAFCNWAGRRLPTEAEWEMAASTEPGYRAGESSKRLFPWGDEPPEQARINMDWTDLGCTAVGALPEGDSAWGCRQMIGNVWEWTSTDFLPYPGFVRDPYEEYSEPWFGSRKVLRGGCWSTRSRLVRNTWRNFFAPERRDVFAGFRTCGK